MTRSSSEGSIFAPMLILVLHQVPNDDWRAVSYVGVRHTEHLRIMTTTLLRGFIDEGVALMTVDIIDTSVHRTPALVMAALAGVAIPEDQRRTGGDASGRRSSAPGLSVRRSRSR